MTVRIDIRIDPLEPTSTAAARLLELSDQYAMARYPPKSNHLVSSAVLARPNARFVGAYVADALVGCGAAIVVDDDGRYGEMKRVFVIEEYRGKGIAKAIMRDLEHHLQKMGVVVARLETGVKEPAASALYRSLGYVERGPFGSYRHDPLSVFMEKQLASAEPRTLISDLYDHPDLYDALLPVSAHVPFYVDVARQQAGAVLEIACGTGQLTIPVASHGHPTVGLDQSSAMLNVARRRASAVGASVAFVQGDMRNFALDRNFDLIFVARNSLLHLLSTEDLLAAFTAARRHLAPDGVFAFDIFNPDVGILARSAGQRVPAMEVKTTPFGPLSVEQTCDYDSATQVNRGTWYISTPERRDTWIVPLVLRSIFPQELPLLLSAAGLELTSRFGDLSRGPFSHGSRMQVCLCRRRV